MDSESLDARKKNYDNIWNKKYNALLEFIGKYSRYPSMETNEEGLGYWIKVQRANYNKGRMSEYRLAKLNSINFFQLSTNRKHNDWEESYNRLKRFVEINGRFPNTSEDRLIKVWIHGQKKRYNLRKLSQYKITKLKEIPGWEWTMKKKNNTWQKNYNKLARFIKTNGRLPYKGEDKILETWIYDQRRAYKTNKISQKSINLLEMLNCWEWEKDTRITASWFDNFDRLSKFVSKKNRLPLSELDGREIFRWMTTQKKLHQKGELFSGQIEKLEDLKDWAWELV